VRARCKVGVFSRRVQKAGVAHASWVYQDQLHFKGTVRCIEAGKLHAAGGGSRSARESDKGVHVPRGLTAAAA
jgi:hypothetical protein